MVPATSNCDRTKIRIVGNRRFGADFNGIRSRHPHLLYCVRIQDTTCHY